MLRDAIAMAVVVALSGCAPRTTTPPSPVAPIPGDAVPTESNFIHGRATYLERIKIPPGADFTVQLIDSQLADTPQAVIAETTLQDVAGPPYEFSLQYDPAKLRPNGQYGLSANLRGVDGNLLFVTDTRVPVVPGDQKVVEFRMKRVGTGDVPPPTVSAGLNRNPVTHSAHSGSTLSLASMPSAPRSVVSFRRYLPATMMVGVPSTAPAIANWRAVLSLALTS